MIAVYIPPLDVSGGEVANVLAAVGEQSDKPLVSFLGAEGAPELLRVPDVAGLRRTRPVPSYPRWRRVRALARVVEYAVAARPRRTGRRGGEVDARRPAPVDGVLSDPAVVALTVRSSSTRPGHPAARGVRHRAVADRAGHRARGTRSPPGSGWAGTWC